MRAKAVDALRAVEVAEGRSEKALERLELATAGLQAPFAVVDLDALDANAAAMERRAAGKPIRLASKSVRCRAIQERVLNRGGFSGTLAFTLPEALWLSRHGVDDILVAYPTVDRPSLAELPALMAERPHARITVMVDSLRHVELIEAAGASPGTPVRVCIDVDAGWWPFGGRLRVGAKRSPIHTPAQARALAEAVVQRRAVRLVGIMAYESQIAGVGDAPAGNILRTAAIRTAAIRVMQARSASELAHRRAAVVAAVASATGGALEFVNGGGTGSLGRTAAEPAVTEVGAGSGLYGPTLFDAYRSFRPSPAAMFALPVVRRPSSRAATVLGGGYVASGPTGPSRLPAPHLPAGLRLDRTEGAGEVQTPLLGTPAGRLQIGDRVWFRHAKAGELCERFQTLYAIQGERIVDELPTYRGEGCCFL